VQLPLHEPYFDFTLISVVHTKNPIIKIINLIHLLTNNRKANLLHKTPFSMRRVVSTNPKFNSPCHGDSRLLAITYSNSRVSDYYSFLIVSYFIWFAKFHNFASFCLGICGTSKAHNIKAMMTCLSPYYHYLYIGESALSIFLKIKPGFTLILWI
jgi:hypothetical protein